jgi:hypothetical protein
VKIWPLDVSEQAAGYYKARIADWTIKEAESGSKSVSMCLHLEEQYDFGDKDRPAKWDSWREQTTNGEPYRFMVYCDLYFFKKKKGATEQTMDARTLEQLKTAGIWNEEGFKRFAAPPPDGFEIVVQVKYEPARDQYEARVVGDRVFPITHTPQVAGGLANKASADRLAALEAQYGAQVRALLVK